MAIDGTIGFSYNWNNKLRCKVFTTVRRYNPRKYSIGKIHQVLLKDKTGGIDLGRAEIIEAKRMTLKQISAATYTCYLDTGYSPEETVGILKRMHKAGMDGEFSVVLYKYIDGK